MIRNLIINACVVTGVAFTIAGFATAQPTTRPDADERTDNLRRAVSRVRGALLNELAKLDSEIGEIRQRSGDYRTNHPALGTAIAVENQLSSFARALAEAEIARLNAQSNYPPSHPVVAKAKHYQDAMQRRYDEARDQYLELDHLVAEQNEIKDELAIKVAQRQRLEERLESLRVFEELLREIEEKSPPGARSDDPNRSQQHPATRS